ncbi:hypothetical protein L345_00551, partial [Ophiophagus hannah]
MDSHISQFSKKAAHDIPLLFKSQQGEEKKKVLSVTSLLLLELNRRKRQGRKGRESRRSGASASPPSLQRAASSPRTVPLEHELSCLPRHVSRLRPNVGLFPQRYCLQTFR